MPLMVPVGAGAPVEIGDDAEFGEDVEFGEDRRSRWTNRPATRRTQAARPAYSVSLFFVPTKSSYRHREGRRPISAPMTGLSNMH
jgi:hypothetical protein